MVAIATVAAKAIGPAISAKLPPGHLLNRPLFDKAALQQWQYARALRGSYPKGLDGRSFKPSGWRQGETRIGSATKRSWQGGTSMETPYSNIRNGKMIYRHTIIDKHGRIVHDHFRPYSKPTDFGG